MAAHRIQKQLIGLISLISLIALGTSCQVQSPLPASPSRPELRLRLNLPASFKILSPSQPADVHSLRFCLLEHPTGSSPAGGEDLEPVGQVFTYQLTHTPPLELNFGHIRANAAGQSYSVAVAALDEAGNNITNATGDNALQHRVSLSGEAGNFTLSTGGGDPDFAGSVRVSPFNYTLSGTPTLSVSIKLADG